MNLAALMARAGRARPDNAAIAVGDVLHARYGDLSPRVARMAGWLRGEAGLRSGDRVAFAMKNCPQFVELLYAVWHAGLVAVPVNAKLHPTEFGYIFENSGARLVVATEDLAPALAPVVDGIAAVERMIVIGFGEYRAMDQADPIGLVDVAPADPAWLFYTSGTTGRPKGAVLSHRSLMNMTTTYFADVDTIAEGDAILHPAPMSHGSGCYNLPHVARAAIQVVPPSGGFEPAEIYELIRLYPGSSFFAAPTMVKRLVEYPGAAAADTSNLKTIVYGGGPMYVADAKKALALFGDKLVQIYGQGESPMTITCLPRADHADRGHPRHEDRLGSVGMAFTNVEVRVADEQDRTLPPGDVGEVLVRGDVVMSGYWNNPDATAETMRGGWLHTGDVGAMDADGYLTLKDRSKDMIISGGTNIYPREVEEVLLRHPAVLEVSVIGVPDPEWGENVVAYVVARDPEPPRTESLDGFCIEHMARFKRPKLYRFVDVLPKNNYGKVVKTVLRERFRDEG